jgi:hypothetical protein
MGIQASEAPKLPTTTLLETMDSRFGEAPREPNVLCGMGGVADPSPFQIGQCLWTLLAAILGGVLARAVFVSQPARPVNFQATAQPTVQPPRTGWSWLILGVISAPPVFTSAATVGTRSNPGLWAGATFFFTCGLLGVAILAAIFGRGRTREFGLGAALFGIGHLLLALGRPADRWTPPRTSLITDELVQAVRARLPTAPRNMAATNARIRDALEQPIPMHFPDETPLADVLKSIKQATSTPDHAGIPIYVNPLGLQEAERSLNSTVQIDLERVPLKTTLRLCLEQLGLAYSIQGGYLEISSEDSVSADLEDPLRIVGHCLLAMIAAMIGGVTALLVSDARRERPGNGEIPDASTPGRVSANQAG